LNNEYTKEKSHHQQQVVFQAVFFTQEKTLETKKTGISTSQKSGV
jgi:hypothetical protein